MARLLLCLVVLSTLSLAEAGGGRGTRQCNVTAPCLDQLTAFKAEFATSFNFPVDFQAHGHLAFDQKREFLDFEFTVDKGIKELEDLARKDLPPPPGGLLQNDYDTVGDLEDSMKLDGNEGFSLKARVLHDHLSLGLTVSKAGPIPFFPPGSDTLCIDELQENLEPHFAGALQQMQPGTGIHGVAPHPKREMDGYRNDLPSSAERGEREAIIELEDVLEEAGPDSDYLQIPGHTTYVLHLDKVGKAAEQRFPQAKDMVEKVEQGQQIPNLLLFAHKEEKRLSKIMFDVSDVDFPPVPGTDRQAPKVLWFNITSLKMDGSFDISRKPVCTDGQNVDELMRTQGLGPPQRRRLGDGPMKLLALETLSKVFRVTKVVAPSSRKLLPSDATQLWNAKDREAALIERALTKRVIEASKSAQVQPSPNLLVGGMSLLVVASFAIGVALGRRRPSSKSATSHEELLQLE